MATELELAFCPDCQRDVFAEAPPCIDGHGDGCPDRACVHCGAALLLDAPLFDIAFRSELSSAAIRRAPHAA